MYSDNIVSIAKIKPGKYCRASQPFGLIDQGIYRYEGTSRGVAYLSAGTEIVGISSTFLPFFSEVKSKESLPIEAVRQRDYREFLITKLSQHGADQADLKLIN